MTTRDLITEERWLNTFYPMDALENEETEATTLVEVSTLKTDEEWEDYWAAMLGETGSYEPGWNMKDKEHHRKKRWAKRSYNRRVAEINMPRYLREKKLFENGRSTKKPISLHRRRGNEKNEFPTKPVITRQQNNFLKEINALAEEESSNEEKEWLKDLIVEVASILFDLMKRYEKI